VRLITGRSFFVTYVVSLLLVLVSFLVGSSLSLVGGTLLVAQCLPPLSQNLADLAEGNTRVLLADIVPLLVREEHVGRETSLGGIGVFVYGS